MRGVRRECNILQDSTFPRRQKVQRVALITLPQDDCQHTDHQTGECQFVSWCKHSTAQRGIRSHSHPCWLGRIGNASLWPPNAALRGCKIGILAQSTLEGRPPALLTPFPPEIASTFDRSLRVATKRKRILSPTGEKSSLHAPIMLMHARRKVNNMMQAEPRTRTHIYMHIHAYIHTLICAYKRTHTHIFTYIHIHTHIHGQNHTQKMQKFNDSNENQAKPSKQGRKGGFVAKRWYVVEFLRRGITTRSVSCSGITEQ